MSPPTNTQQEPIIYTSAVASPTPHLPRRSLFTHLLGSDSQYGSQLHDTDLAFVDAKTGTGLTRGLLRDLALRLGYALTRAGSYSGGGGWFGGIGNATTGTGLIKVRRGDTVMVFSPNGLWWPLVAFGGIASGLRLTLANSAYTAYELGFQYTNSGATLVFTIPDLVPVVLEMFEKTMKMSKEEARKRIVIVGEGLEWANAGSRGVGAIDARSLAGAGVTTASATVNAAGAGKDGGFVRMEDLLNHGKLEKEEEFDGKKADETLFLCYSSGTTGKPKGVETTHFNIISVLGSIQATFTPIFPQKDKLLGILPFYHIYGLVKLVLWPLFINAPCVIMTRFEPVEYCKNVERYGITFGLVVPPVLVVLDRHPGELCVMLAQDIFFSFS